MTPVVWLADLNEAQSTSISGHTRSSCEQACQQPKERGPALHRAHILSPGGHARSPGTGLPRPRCARRPLHETVCDVDN
jgi:hypothetical protein